MEIAIEQREAHRLSSVEKVVVGRKIIHYPQGHIDAFQYFQDRQVRTGQLQPWHGSNTPFLGSDLALVRIEYWKENQILTRMVQWTNHLFPAYSAIDWIYKFHLRSGESLNLNRCSRQGSSLREDTCIIPPSLAIDWIYEFHLRSGKSLSLNRCSRQGASLKENPSIMVGKVQGLLSREYQRIIFK